MKHRGIARDRVSTEANWNRIATRLSWPNATITSAFQDDFGKVEALGGEGSGRSTGSGRRTEEACRLTGYSARAAFASVGQLAKTHDGEMVIDGGGSVGVRAGFPPAKSVGDRTTVA